MPRFLLLNDLIYGILPLITNVGCFRILSSQTFLTWTTDNELHRFTTHVDVIIFIMEYTFAVYIFSLFKMVHFNKKLQFKVSHWSPCPFPKQPTFGIRGSILPFALLQELL